MWNKLVSWSAGLLKYIPNQFKTQEMCEQAVYDDPTLIEYVPDYYITNHICECAKKYTKYIDAYKERKNLKLKIERDLLPAAWHPSRTVDWCFDEDEKKYVPSY